MTDLIIGGSTGYNWDQLKYWVNSIQNSGYTGDIVLVSGQMDGETRNILKKKGVEVVRYDAAIDDGSGGFKSKYTTIPLAPNHTMRSVAPHVERFFYIWKYLNEKSKHRYVISTDTRDVVFQSNPVEWLEKNLGMRDFVAPSEGIQYMNEPWNSQNMFEAFGSYYQNLYKECLIYNVGVLAGHREYMTALTSMIYHMSLYRPTQVVDQAVFNLLLNQAPWSHNTYFAENSDAWAAQMACTIGPVRSGYGPVSHYYHDKPDAYNEVYLDKQPILNADGTVSNAYSKLFSIVHQYDRLIHPDYVDWLKTLKDRYND
jgi:hypothetical protein